MYDMARIEAAPGTPLQIKRTPLSFGDIAEMGCEVFHKPSSSRRRLLQDPRHGERASPWSAKLERGVIPSAAMRRRARYAATSQARAVVTMRAASPARSRRPRATARKRSCAARPRAECFALHAGVEARGRTSCPPDDLRLMKAMPARPPRSRGSAVDGRVCGIGGGGVIGGLRWRCAVRAQGADLRRRPGERTTRSAEGRRARQVENGRTLADGLACRSSAELPAVINARSGRSCWCAGGDRRRHPSS